jgi:hypothetical protein
MQSNKLTRLLAKLSVWAPPGHFYSPVVDRKDPNVRAIMDNFDHLALTASSGIDLDPARILRTLEDISVFHAELPFTDQPNPNTRYYFSNGRYDWGDAVVYFGIMRHFRPARIIEIGGGYSSCVAMDTNDLFFDGRMELMFIEPFPKLLFSLMRPDDRYRANVRVAKLQDVPLSIFEDLRENDILFIDSSHVAKTGSDVNDYMFRILPSLRPGVLIHIHDIPYPFEYSPQWVLKENRSWNEAYLLRAFLQFNASFEIIYYNHYVQREFPDKLAARMPTCMRNTGAAIWLRRVK